METVVYAGFNRDGEFRQFVRVNRSSFHVHPAFVRDTLVHDIGLYSKIHFPAQNLHRFPKELSQNLCVLDGIGLIELPTPIKLDRFIESAKLPTDCGENLVDEPAYTAGVGTRTFNNYVYDEDTRIHHAYLLIIANDICQRLVQHQADLRSIICAYSPLRQTPYHGDSGRQ